MRIVAMTNDGQLPMMKNMLNSAQKAGWPLHLFHCYIIGSHSEAAPYNSVEFQSLTLRKLEVILENMKQDREVLWIDNDVYLFQNTIDDMRRYPGGYVMQDDLWSPCTGFFLVRSSMTTMRAIENSITWLRAKQNTGVNDQHAFASVYRKILGLFVSKLPQDEYPNGEVYFNQKRIDKARMVHSNYLTTTAEKVDRFKLFNLWDESDAAFNIVNRYSI